MAQTLEQNKTFEGVSAEYIEKVIRTADDAYIEPGESHHKDKKERRLVLKQDVLIVVLLSGCYWFAYLVSVKPIQINQPQTDPFLRTVEPLVTRALWDSRKTCI